MKPRRDKHQADTQAQRILQYLRTRIMLGEFSPGSRLPTFEQLESQLSAGRTVIQLAIAQLKADGFITSCPRQGMYIADKPPHMDRFALVFPVFPGHRQWSGFHEAMMQQARHMSGKKSPVQFEMFLGINDERRGGEVLDTFLKQVHRQHLAGIILLHQTHDLATHDIVIHSQIPLVIVDGERGMTPRPQICTDIPMLFKHGITSLKQAGRKRIAMVYMGDTFTWLTPAHFQEVGIAYRKAWVQCIGRSHPQTVESVIHLLMDYPVNKRPDGLFIADDNLLSLSLTALDAMGLQIGKDLDVVSHFNWPCAAHCRPSVIRVGFDAGKLLQSCLDVFATPVRDGVDQRVLDIPALLESEMGV